MQVETLPLGPIDTNAYVVRANGSSEAIVIDAPFDAEEEIPPFLQENDLSLKAIILTHGHWDHIGGAAKLAAQFDAPIIAGEDGKELYDAEFQMRHMYLSTPIDDTKIAVYAHDGDTLEYAGLKIKCLEVPGHCPGSFAYLISDGDETCLFSGDLIFENSVGRTDFWRGDFATLENSIKQKIYTLPDSTVIYPGHGIFTYVGDEKKQNPFVRP